MAKIMEKKMLGANVDADIYWEFKRIAAIKQETTTQAVTAAVLLYIKTNTEIKENNSQVMEA